MIKDIKYATTVNFMGRNGMFKQTGIAVTLTPGTGHVTLQPFTSRDVIGNSFLEIPLASVDEVIEALRSVKPVKVAGPSIFFKGQSVHDPMGHLHVIESVIPNGHGSFEYKSTNNIHLFHKDLTIVPQ